MADAGAAHDADDGSVGSNETAATVDERDLPSDDASGEGGGDDDGTPSEDDEQPDGSGGGGGGPAFRVREVECGESILVIVDISLPPAGRPAGKPRLNSFLFLRQCEELLYGATAGSYTGALHTAVKNMGLESSLRVMEKSTALEVMEANEWSSLMDVYTTMRRRDDPLCGAAKRFTILPVSLGASLALARRHRDMLVALGKKPPRKWDAEDQRVKLAEEGCTDFNVEAVLEEPEDCDELYGIALGNELSTEFVPFVEVEQDETTSRGYSLKKPSKALQRDLEEYRARRTSTLNRFRKGRAVEQTTCDGDVSNGLRFLGWFKDHRDASEDDGPIPLTLRAVFSHARLGAWVEQYLEFLERRGLQWSSKANYTTGLLNLLEFAIADDGFVLTEERGQSVREQVLNLRRQCDANATIQKMYRRRHKEWLDWDDVQRTRLTCLERLEGATTPKQTHALLQDALMISLFSVTPPDRVGVIRRLMLGVTLRRIADDEEEAEEAEEGTEGDWWIDLTQAKHKTSRFYGPAMTRISDLVAPLIDRFLESKALFHKFEFEYTPGQYLFSTGKDHRAYSVSQWTAAIKAAFGRHSPNGEAPPPKLLRSSFITMLRSSERTPAVLKSAAGVMKHALSTSESDVYDKAVHEKLLSASFEFCEDYARTIEAQMKQGGASGKAKSKATKGKGKERASKATASKSAAAPPTTPVKTTPSTTGPTTPAKGKRRAVKPAPPAPPEAAALVGRAVRKRFDGKWFGGTIDSYAHPYLKVVYSDGDVEEVDVDQARLLASGVDVDVRVQYHFGTELGWIGGVVLGKYRRGCVIYEPDELAEDSTSTAMAWRVEWDDGDLECVDLCLERQSRDAQAGNWHLETDSSGSASSSGN